MESYVTINVHSITVWHITQIFTLITALKATVIVITYGTLIYYNIKCKFEYFHGRLVCQLEDSVIFMEDI